MTGILGGTMKPLIKMGRKPSDCWQWLGGHTSEGYPVKCHSDGATSAQRWLWRTIFGPIPDELKITTTCANQACMNPAHWSVDTQAGICRNGAKATLLPGDVIDIRRARKGATVHTITDLADRYGVAPETIRSIWGHRSWVSARGPSALAEEYSALPYGQTRRADGRFGPIPKSNDTVTTQ